MIDFTKEELELILKSIWWGGEDDDTESLQNIDDKIQSMIDNYCDHENASSIHPGDTVLICNKCETILSHWNLRKAKV